MKTKFLKRVFPVVLSLMIALAFVPAIGYADSGSSINVKYSIVDQGKIAADKDGNPMAWKDVSVSDANGDGHFTYDEALTAVHEQYYVDGAAGVSIASSGWILEVWGVEQNPASYSIIRNNVAPMDLAPAIELSDGDYLVTSINQDAANYADWNSYFDKYEADVLTGEPVSLTLKGYQAMTVNDPAPAKNVELGLWKNGAFSEFGITTDDNGEAAVSFDKPGTYIVTAQGTVEDTITDWNLLSDPTYYGTDDDGNAIWVRLNEELDCGFEVAYTDEDYGDGPYPVDEVKYIDWMEWFGDDEFEGHLLYSNQLLKDCPLISPVCIVKVKNFKEQFEAEEAIIAAAGVTKESVDATAAEKIDIISAAAIAQINEVSDVNSIAPIVDKAIQDMTDVADNAKQSALAEKKTKAMTMVMDLLTANKGKVSAVEATQAALEAIVAIEAADDAVTIDDIYGEYETAIDKLVKAKAAADAKAKVKNTQIKGLIVTAGKKKATVQWTKNAKVFQGYQIQYKKAGTKAKTVKITKNTTAKKVIKNLVSKKKYTFKVRGYKKVNGSLVNGKWSVAKTVKIK